MKVPSKLCTFLSPVSSEEKGALKFTEFLYIRFDWQPCGKDVSYQFKDEHISVEICKFLELLVVKTSFLQSTQGNLDSSSIFCSSRRRGHCIPRVPSVAMGGNVYLLWGRKAGVAAKHKNSETKGSTSMRGNKVSIREQLWVLPETTGLGLKLKCWPLFLPLSSSGPSISQPLLPPLQNEEFELSCL